MLSCYRKKLQHWTKQSFCWKANLMSRNRRGRQLKRKCRPTARKLKTSPSWKNSWRKDRLTLSSWRRHWSKIAMLLLLPNNFPWENLKFRRSSSMRNRKLMNFFRKNRLWNKSNSHRMSWHVVLSMRLTKETIKLRDCFKKSRTKKLKLQSIWSKIPNWNKKC